VQGTLGNCAGGTTPWGTILSGEENFNGYFRADPNAKGAARYGLISAPSVYGFEAVDPRFDATKPDYAGEPNRFGWIVEIDPYDPTSTPRKLTALGRMKHEGANVRVDEHNNVAVYMGDDERFDYLYKFVAKRKYDPRGGRRNKDLLTEGDLYVAKFDGEQEPDNANLGTGTWLPLTQNGESVIPGMSTEEVLVFTRLAADTVGATPDGPAGGRRGKPAHRHGLCRLHQQQQPWRCRQAGHRCGQSASGQQGRPHHRAHRQGQQRAGDDVRVESVPGLR
jgi:secreted PhoX family phosphatase